MRDDSIFSPAFGNRPKELVGRSEIIRELTSGLDSAPGSKDRAVMLLGQRGYGKTVLLLEFAELAKKHNYVVASPTVTSTGMLARIVEKIQDEGEQLLQKGKARLTGGSFGFLGFSAGLQFSVEENEAKSFSYKLSKLVAALEEKQYGTLILVDEVQANSSDLRELIIAYQELVGAGKNVALVLAGLPGAVSSILNNKVLTFLNRSKKIELPPLSFADIDAYYCRSFQKLGIDISPSLRHTVSEEAQGSPYLMQLLGHYLTIYSEEQPALTSDFISQAIAMAKAEFVNDICKTSLASLTDKDILFLKSMAADSGKSRTADVARRMGVTADYAQQYRRRLIDGGIIAQERRGEVGFAIPYLKEYLSQT